MRLDELKLKLISLNPYKMLKSHDESPEPFSYFELPKEMYFEIASLSEEELYRWDEFCDMYLYELQKRGWKSAAEFMQCFI